MGAWRIALPVHLMLPLLHHRSIQGTLARFSALLDQGLEKSSKRITFELRSHIGTIESKLDSTSARTKILSALRIYNSGWMKLVTKLIWKSATAVKTLLCVESLRLLLTQWQ